MCSEPTKACRSPSASDTIFPCWRSGSDSFPAAINACNVNNQPDTIELAAGSTYTFSAAAEAADSGNALPSILRDSGLDANTVTIHGNGATVQRAAGAPNFRFLRIGVFPNNVA